MSACVVQIDMEYVNPPWVRSCILQWINKRNIPLCSLFWNQYHCFIFGLLLHSYHVMRLFLSLSFVFTMMFSERKEIKSRVLLSSVLTYTPSRELWVQHLCHDLTHSFIHLFYSSFGLVDAQHVDQTRYNLELAMTNLVIVWTLHDVRVLGVSRFL